jgi:hypothetical protein
MAYGPKLQFIKAGDALVADTVMQNFQTIVDFLRAIPSNNLLQYKYTWSGQGEVGAIGPGAGTLYSGYQKLNVGGTPVGIELTATLVLPAPGPLGAGQSVVVKWQKCTPANVSGPKNTDVWVDLALPITFDPTNTTLADLVLDPSQSAYCQTAVLNNLPAIIDGDWIRLEVEAIGAGVQISKCSAQINIKNPLRS